jgi:hypothetical protein
MSGLSVLGIWICISSIMGKVSYNSLIPWSFIDFCLLRSKFKTQSKSCRVDAS